MFVDALWPPAGKGLTSWLSFVMSYCDVVIFPIGILIQVWCFIVSIPDLCHLSYSVLSMRIIKILYLAICIMQSKRHCMVNANLSKPS